MENQANKIEEKIKSDMRKEGKVFEVFLILLVAGLIFSLGLMY
jgi:hypothetical protein